ncbi:MAG: PAS domain S-box protein, partial [Leptolyngbya sp. SIO3F4]|nr:PAS domain S-box protein [Leptolyngbya sp. SIO3F4]
MNHTINNLVKSRIELKQQLARWQRATHALLATKQRLQRLLASSPSVIYSSQPDNRFGFIFVSDSIRQFGYQPQDFLENLDLWLQCIHPDDISYALSPVSATTQHQYTLEYRFRHRNGDYRWIQDQRNLIVDAHGDAVEIIGSWQDITERKQMEQALFEKKELAQNILQSIGDGVITTDALGHIQYINSAAEQITGQALESVLGQHLSFVFKSHDTDSTCHIIQSIKTAKSLCKVVSLNADRLFVIRDSEPYKSD